MRNVTIKVDEEVARWARVFAARHGTSVSRLLGDLLRERMKQENAYEQARLAWSARRPTTLKPSGAPYPARDALHERG